MTFTLFIFNQETFFLFLCQAMDEKLLDSVAFNIRLSVRKIKLEHKVGCKIE